MTEKENSMLKLKKIHSWNWAEMGNIQRSKVLRNMVFNHKEEIEELFRQGGSIKDIQAAFHAVDIDCHYNSVRNALIHHDINML